MPSCYISIFNQPNMQKIVLPVVALAMVVACTTNKFTGKKQFNLISSEQMLNLGETQYRQVLSSSKVLSNTADSRKVVDIGQRIAGAVNRYYSGQGLQQELAGYKWEYNLIDSKEVNAWCMPGGKIAVYTGLLPVTQNDAALAVVMGHEVAHALAEHGKDRIHQQLGASALAMGLQVAVANKPQETQLAYLAAFGAASQLGVILPFSRRQELEADALGLKYAALAGYDPREAIGLWQRMGALGGGSKPPEFASTHPAEATRIAELEKLMPEAVKLYEANRRR